MPQTPFDKIWDAHTSATRPWLQRAVDRRRSGGT